MDLAAAEAVIPNFDEKYKISQISKSIFQQ